MIRRINALLLALVVVVSFICGGTEAAERNTAKYVFLFIGDGMGIPQRAATAAFLEKELTIDKLPAQGITTTYANDRFITGSAASATALSTGYKTNINYIGVDPEFKTLKSVAEMAKDKGMKVGIVSSVSIDHATPAAFYAHVKSRSMYHEIDNALVSSDFDLFAGGGLKDPTGKKSKNPQGNALEKAEKNGYKLVDNKADFMSLTPDSGKVIAWNAWLQDSKALPYVMDMTENDITLPEFTEKAIELLDNPKGFFLMVEGGKIDWACHANDASAAILNTKSFDDSVKIALDFYKAHPNETLIVVTGDHECGGLTLGFAGTKYGSNFEVLGSQKESFQKFTDDTLKKFKADKGTFDDMKKIITTTFGLKFTGSKDDPTVLSDFEITELQDAFKRSMDDNWKENAQEYLIYGNYEPLAVTITHLLNQKAGLAWTSYKHTGVPVTTSAIGVNEQSFNGSYDNTDVAKKIMSAMDVVN